MKMIKCIKGHAYNADKFSNCPYCNGMDVQDNTMSEEKQDAIDTEDPSTVKQQNYEIIGRRKVVGCLICTNSMMYGEGFFLVEGHNDIGRTSNLEVALTKEITVSRKAHACIIYDTEKNQYVLKADNRKKDVFYNNALVEKDILLENYATITIGQCNLRFIAFCNDDFVWDKQ